MHTLRMTAAGLILFALFFATAKLLNNATWTMERAVRIFIPLWFLVAVANMMVGMLHAGIPFMTELPVLGVVFGVPALAAFYIGRRAGS